MQLQRTIGKFIYFDSKEDKGDFVIRLKNYVELRESVKMINSSFRVPGLIVEYPIKVGDKLHKGQVLAKLDTHDYELQLQKARAAHAAAVSEDQKATAQYKRIKVLYESESASRDEFDLARAAYAAARADIAAKGCMVVLLGEEFTLQAA